MADLPLADCSQASEASSLASSAQASALPGPLSGMNSSGLALLTDFPLPPTMVTFVESARTAFQRWMSSPQDFPARTSLSWGTAPKKDRRALPVPEVVYSGKPYVSSEKYAHGGWSLKTSRNCSLATVAATLRRSSGGLPTAGTWDASGCWMLRVSAFPRDVKGFTWSGGLDVSPPSHCWMMPGQWKAYLARLARSRSHGTRMHRQAIAYLPQTPAPGSPWVVSYSSLTRTDGVRWMTGKECLQAAGFPEDWMTPALLKHTQLVTPWFRKLRSGSLEKFVRS